MFRFFIIILVIFNLGYLSPVLAVQFENSNPISDKMAKKLEAIKLLGMQIYAKDMAAWVASDTLIASKALIKDNQPEGWVTEKKNDGWIVTFIGKKKKRDKAFYSVEVTNNKTKEGSLKVFKKGKSLTKFQRKMYRARKTAFGVKDLAGCSSNYNTVVLPQYGKKGKLKGFYVYLLAAMTRMDEVKIGGHYRISIKANGKKVEEVKPFSNSCITMPRTEDTASIVVSHLLAETPEETHMFLSLQQGIPFYVVTTKNSITWRIENGNIDIINSP